MGFTNAPPAAELAVLGTVSTTGALFAVSGFPSLLLVPSAITGDNNVDVIEVDWYVDAAKTIKVSQENYAVNAIAYPLVAVQCKAPYAEVSIASGFSTDTVIVCGSSATVNDSTRLDKVAIGGEPLVNFALMASTSIPVSQAVTTATANGFCAGTARRWVVAQVRPLLSPTINTTLTAAFTLSVPSITDVLLNLGTVTAAGITSAGPGGAVVNTAPIELPAMPADTPIQLALSFTLAAASSGQSYDVSTMVF